MRPRIFIALSCSALLLGGCGRKESAGEDLHPPATAIVVEPGIVTIAANSPMLEQIHVATVQTADVPTAEVDAPGKIEVNPNRVSHVVLPVAGRVTAVLVKLGDAVGEGQLLLTGDFCTTPSNRGLGKLDPLNLSLDSNEKA